MNGFAFESIELLNNACSIEKLSNCFENLIQSLGFSSFTYGSIRLPSIDGIEQIIQTKYDPTWVEHYVNEGYQNQDPVIEEGLSSLVPFNWLQVADQNSKIIQEGGEFGHGMGVTIPIHGNFGELALLSASVDSSQAELDKISNANLPYFQFIAFHYHRRLVELLQTEDFEPIKLTARETEVLRWTAQGKTAWEIAGILNLAERSISQYVQSSMRKLGVFNKQHAVAKALVSGLISI